MSHPTTDPLKAAELKAKVKQTLLQQRIAVQQLSVELAQLNPWFAHSSGAKSLEKLQRQIDRTLQDIMELPL